MDRRHRGALPRSAGQAGQTLQIHRDVFCDAENRSRPPYGQLLLLGHQYGRQLHREVGEPHHVLCGERVRRVHRLGCRRLAPPAGRGAPPPAGGDKVPQGRCGASIFNLRLCHVGETFCTRA